MLSSEESGVFFTSPLSPSASSTYRIPHVDQTMEGALTSNKKALLRERKRHNARHVANARSVVLSPDGGRVPPSSPDGARGTPIQS